MKGTSFWRIGPTATASVAALVVAASGVMAQDAAVQLDQVNVTGGQGGIGVGSGVGPFPGLVAPASTAGTKTDTPIIETPQSLTVIGRDRLDTFQSVNVNEALRYTPGVSPDVYGVDQRSDNYITIRGLPANFFQDNLQLPLLPPYGSWRVDPWSLERVEVLRGPASILYGQGNPGGTVNYVSKRPTSTPIFIGQTLFGSQGLAQLNLDQGGPIDPQGAWSYRVAATLYRTNLDFGNPNEGRRLSLSPSLRWSPDASTSMTVFANYLRDHTSIDTNFLPAQGTVLFNPFGQIPRSTWTGNSSFDGYDKTQWSIGYEFEHEINKVWTVRQNLRFNHIESDIKTVYGAGLYPSPPDNYQYIAELAARANPGADRFAVDTQAQAKFDLGETSHTMLFGVDYAHQKTWDPQFYNFSPYLLNLFQPSYASLWDLQLFPAQNTRQYLDQVGLYAQDQMKVTDRVVITAGLRYDIARQSFRDTVVSDAVVYNNNYVWSPRVGAVILMDGGFAPYGSYTQSFLPNVGSNVEGQPFGPSFGRQGEVGVRYVPPGTNSQLSVAAFSIDQTNVISQVGPNLLDAFAQDLNSRGFEAEALLQFEEGFRAIGSFTFQDVRVTGDADPTNVGKRPVAVPDTILQLWADYKFSSTPLSGLRVGAGIRYYGSTMGDVENTFKVPNFTLVDAGVSYDIQNWRLAINANNILDTHYVAACSGETACFYGTGRKVLGSVRYTW
ncbi:TonB-dependent siderophore receptor [Methylocella sp.]|uniref:TonB-dependent siderophore receptor n=1 Tax=Methylocella sp. TaxID=1978226 RepID=UPI003785161B